MKKRETLYNLLDAYNFNPPKLLLVEPSYNLEIDNYLYEEVGYDVLNNLVNGLFVSAYAATSVSEYYARGFEEWVFGHRTEIKKLSPALYRIFDDLFEEAK